MQSKIFAIKEIKFTVPAEKIYVDMMTTIGFVDVKYHIVRKRNCNKQLYEFVVSGQK